MKRFIVLAMLLTLPIRTVLAVSGIGCAMSPPQQMSLAGHMPCAMHMMEADATEEPMLADAQAADAADSEAEPTCPLCAAVCCAALAPASASISAASLMADHVSAAISATFHNALVHSLERPPRPL